MWHMVKWLCNSNSLQHIGPIISCSFPISQKTGHGIPNSKPIVVLLHPHIEIQGSKLQCHGPQPFVTVTAHINMRVFCFFLCPYITTTIAGKCLLTTSPIQFLAHRPNHLPPTDFPLQLLASLKKWWDLTILTKLLLFSHESSQNPYFHHCKKLYCRFLSPHTDVSHPLYCQQDCKHHHGSGQFGPVWPSDSFLTWQLTKPLFLQPKSPSLIPQPTAQLRPWHYPHPPCCL